jgi:Tfp pilus assembly protein FimT
MNSKQLGNTLIGLLVAIAIIAILAVVYLKPNGGVSTRKDGKGITTVGASMMKAKDTACKSNLIQVRQLIYVQVETNGDDQANRPTSIEQVSGLPASMRNCPIGSEPYELDAQTLKAKCPHPGHEKY